MEISRNSELKIDVLNCIETEAVGDCCQQKPVDCKPLPGRCRHALESEIVVASKPFYGKQCSNKRQCRYAIGHAKQLIMRNALQHHLIIGEAVAAKRNEAEGSCKKCSGNTQGSLHAGLHRVVGAVWARLGDVASCHKCAVEQSPNDEREICAVPKPRQGVNHKNVCASAGE